jgi:hypothetical protein
MGYAADPGDGRIRAPNDLIRRLAAAGIDWAGRALAAERERQWHPANAGNPVRGPLRQIADSHAAPRNEYPKV